MEKKTWVDIGIIAIKVIVAVIFVFFLVCSAVYILSDTAPLLEEPQPYVLTDWVYRDEKGEDVDITTPYVIDVKDRSVFTFETTLPPCPDGSVLVFLNMCDIDISVDHNLIYSWRRSEVPLPGSSVKNAYFFVNLPQNGDGSVLTVTRYGTLAKKYLECYVGEKSSIIRMVEVKKGLVNFGLSVFLLMFSTLIMATSIILGFIFKKRIPLTLASAGIFVTSCWLVFDSFVFSFVFRTHYIDGIMSYITTLCMIFGFIFYLDELQGRRYHKVYFGVGALALLNLLVFAVLNFTGIQSFSQSLLSIDLVLAVGIVTTFVVTVIDIKRGEAKEYSIVITGFILFMVFCILEIIMINVIAERVEGLQMLIGLYILLGFAIAQQVVDLQKVQHECDLATANASARTQFLANMSHEIRTPINSILGMNEMIIKETDNPQITSYANVVDNSGKLLLSIINDILDFSKIDSGKHELVMAPYNPKQIINNVCSIIKIRANEKNLDTAFDISEDIPWALYGDAKSISQILLNILSNAVKYTREGSISLYASAKREEDRYLLEFRVTDTGIGIKDEDKKKIFDPFSRSDLKKNTGVQGTGLGLAITKQLVEAMGGTIELESKYGVGSAFTVQIPQRVPTADELAVNPVYDEKKKESAELDVNYTAPNARVLVVDDTSANVIVAKAFLKNSKVMLDTSSGGFDAFRLCCENKYDVILMDHMMPECDGIEAMHLIREKSQSLNASTPIVILTANAIKGSEEKYRSEGFDDYLSKPVDSAGLLRMVRKHLPPEKVIPG